MGDSRKDGVCRILQRAGKHSRKRWYLRQSLLQGALNVEGDSVASRSLKVQGPLKVEGDISVTGDIFLTTGIWLKILNSFPL